MDNKNVAAARQSQRVPPKRTLRFQAASNMFATRPAEAKQTLDSAIDEAAQAITEGRDAVEGLRSQR